MNFPEVADSAQATGTDYHSNNETRVLSPLEHVIDVLSLKRAEHPIEPDSISHDFFTGESMYFPTGRVYGGQVLAQSIIAASRTMPISTAQNQPSRLPQSLHGYFITMGKVDEKVLFDVETLRDGRSFSTRRVNVSQSHGTILTAITSFQEDHQSGIDFANPMPQDVPNPCSLPSIKDLLAPYAQHSPFAQFYAHQSPFDIRHVTPSLLTSPASAYDSNDASGIASDITQMVWMKADGEAHVDQTMHRALLALGCDQIMIEPIARRAGVNLMTPGISYASLDHSMWWYRDVDINSWHLYVQHTTTAAHGRGLSSASVYDTEGNLVAAMSQEAMIRVPEAQ